MSVRSKLPNHVRAVLGLLRFSPGDEPVPALDEWEKALRFADRVQLTLPLALRSRERVPTDVQERLECSLAKNASRWPRIREAYEEIASQLHEYQIDFVVLKGFTHCPLFVENPRHRAQYDLDLLVPAAQLRKAYEAARQVGYEPLNGFEEFPLDHLPAMVKKTGWEWTGDYYDVNIPVFLELHFRLWDEQTEGFPVRGLTEFWDRRETRDLEGLRFPSLETLDTVAYANLHLLRHLLRGDLRASHVYELAALLHKTSGDEAFWKTWQARYDETLGQSSAIAFALAQRWFACDLAPSVQQIIHELPRGMRIWLEMYGDSPLAKMFHPNKDEVWLSWQLSSSKERKLSMMIRRVFPQRLPGPVDAVHVDKGQLTMRLRWRARWRYARYLCERLAYHATSALDLACSGVRWFMSVRRANLLPFSETSPLRSVATRQDAISGDSQHFLRQNVGCSGNGTKG
jgi:hypothetical protein